MNARPERIVHLVSEYSAHEAIGLTVTETALRVPGEHHLITTKAHDGGAVFASVHELGGRIESFPMSSRDQCTRSLPRSSRTSCTCTPAPSDRCSPSDQASAPTPWS